MKLIRLSAFAAATMLCAGAQAYPTTVLGDAAPDTTPARTVVITPETRSVDVAFGETVVFSVNGTRSAWQFYTPARSFDLNQVVAALPQTVRVYVGPDLKNNE
jgi:hypothetical protein